VELTESDIENRLRAGKHGVLRLADNSDAYAIPPEGVIELSSHRDDRASRIVFAFVVGDYGHEARLDEALSA
jgi:hypothetical protein